MKLGRAAAAVERWSDESSSTAAILLPLRAGATTLLSTRAPRAGRSAYYEYEYAELRAQRCMDHAAGLDVDVIDRSRLAMSHQHLILILLPMRMLSAPMRGRSFPSGPSSSHHHLVY